MPIPDREIRALLLSGRLRIEELPDLDSVLGSVSVDFRLGNVFLLTQHTRQPFIDPRDSRSISEAFREQVVEDGDAIILQPREFLLASTIESLLLPDDLIARLEGRSSIARMGITVHSTAALFQPGWEGVPQMELSNQSRMAVALYPGMRICAFSFEHLSCAASRTYAQSPYSKYLGQTKPRPSRIAEEWPLNLARDLDAW